MSQNDGIDLAQAPPSTYGAEQYRMLDRQIMRVPLEQGGPNLPAPAQLPQAQSVPTNPLAALFDFSTPLPWLIIGGIVLAIYLSMDEAHER